MMLVGNKIDLADQLDKDGLKRRQVSREEGEALARQEGLFFTETSAKTGEMVVETFTECARDILHKIQRGQGPNGARPNEGRDRILLSRSGPPSKCC